MKSELRSDLWTVVLAGGEGSGLPAALMEAPFLNRFPAFPRERTLLQCTMSRIAALAPAERTVVVVSEDKLDHARTQLQDHPGVEIVPQPENRGTGPGILLPLAHIMACDPWARVAIFPSDHHVRRTEPFLEATRRALRVGAESRSGVCLLGAVADRPATDLGWIVRGDRISTADSAWHVHRFIERPPEPTALQLLATGSLWNTMVVTGRVNALWHMAERHLPIQTRQFETYVRALTSRSGPGVLRELYQQMPPADFTRDVLQAADGLTVVPLVDADWFDCGTPERLLEYLQKPGHALPLRAVS